MRRPQFDQGPLLVRWACCTKHILFDQTTTETLLRYLQHEEQIRIKQFRFNKDKALALVGRLLLRTFLYYYGVDLVASDNSLSRRPTWWDIQLGRTPENKPVLVHNENATTSIPWPENLHFNLSHHGSWVVFSAGRVEKLGIDVSRIERPLNETVGDYLNWFEEQFTPFEWQTIRAHPSHELLQLAQFHRHWCLKESYVKAEGVGLNLDLRRIEFYNVAPSVVDPPCERTAHTVPVNTLESGVRVRFDHVPQPEWQFEMYYVDAEHPVALAYVVNPSTSTEASNSEPLQQKSHAHHINPDRSCPPCLTLLTLDQILEWLPADLGPEM
ncbi:hypothetical protein IWQ62_001947 [Dispira parvispora]|uniref:holo-[acyl-carrier-protein] synthase n=1 Tax=Dispira parvispora TaxID=1520584 RepID=A0A9W8E805_9FUNG|nr:hypothetical protein IWQ62_001947 [Dispira parvispora]